MADGAVALSDSSVRRIRADLTIMIRNQLIEYYVDKEFARETVAKKQHLKLVHQNRQKKVDSKSKP